MSFVFHSCASRDALYFDYLCNNTFSIRTRLRCRSPATTCGGGRYGVGGGGRPLPPPRAAVARACGQPAGSKARLGPWWIIWGDAHRFLLKFISLLKKDEVGPSCLARAGAEENSFLPFRSFLSGSCSRFFSGVILLLPLFGLFLFCFPSQPNRPLTRGDSAG